MIRTFNAAHQRIDWSALICCPVDSAKPQDGRQISASCPLRDYAQTSICRCALRYLQGKLRWRSRLAIVTIRLRHSGFREICNDIIFLARQYG